MTAHGPAAGPPRRLPGTLVDAASDRYRAAGPFAYHFARGKLTHDPAFGAIVERGCIGADSRVLDLGCGQGLLASLLLAAGHRGMLRGIELSPAEARRARAALGDSAEILCGDIRREAFDTVDVVVVLDVLHYMDHPDQDLVLQRIRRALAPGGLLLLRVGDAGAGWRIRLSNWVDQAVVLARRHRIGRLYRRPLGEWCEALATLGFRTRKLPLGPSGTTANVLLEARLPRG